MSPAGLLDRRIRLEQRTTATNARGEVTESFTLIKEVWARYRPIRGTERVKGGEYAADIDVLFTIRYDSSITLKPRDRIVYNGVEYDIMDIRETRHRQRYWEIDTKARRI